MIGTESAGPTNRVHPSVSPFSFSFSSLLFFFKHAIGGHNGAALPCPVPVLTARKKAYRYIYSGMKVSDGMDRVGDVKAFLPFLASYLPN